MIALPFIYFTTWALRNYRSSGFNILTLILSLYAVSAFFSILIDYFGFYAPHSCPKIELGIIAPLLYCALITFCIRPFVIVNKINIKPLSHKAENMLMWISYIYMGIFLIILLATWERTLFVLYSADGLKDIRNEQYTGETVSFYDYLSGWKRYVCAICSILVPSSAFMLMVFGYMLAFSKRRFYYKFIPLIASFAPFPISINVADRSQIIYWIVLLILSLTIFYSRFNRKTKLMISIILSIVLIAIVTYFMAVTTSRFEMRQGGVEGGLILYAGQSYINFCRFLNDITPPLFNLEVLFPTFTRYILNGDSYFTIIEQVERSNFGAPLSVFPTFIGIIYSTCGAAVTLCFIFFYAIIANVVCKNQCRDKTFPSILNVWIVAIVPSLGFIGYYYMSSNTTIAIAVWLLISFLVRKCK